MRSAFAPLALALLALAAAFARWLVQGSGNVYSTTAKRLYIENPDVGWVESTSHPIWLGLDVIAVIAAIAIAVAIGALLIRRRERSTGRASRVLRAASWAAATVPLFAPIAAFATGTGPAGGRSVLPQAEDVAAAAPVESKITGTLGLPAGTYAVVTHDGTSITARLSAGKEEFDARFSGANAHFTGSWQGDPRALDKPMHASVVVDAAAVDTGVGARSDHAREGYLDAEHFPKISFELVELVAAHQVSPDQISFAAKGSIQLRGKTHVVPVTGMLRRADDAARSRLQLTGDVIVAQADFTLPIRETAFAKSVGDFDRDVIPIHVSLVLQRQER